MSDGSSRLRTSLNIDSRRGDASAASSRASGCRRIIVSAADSASRVRPSAYRQKARYSSTCRESSGAAASASMRLKVDKASSYAADAYRSLAALKGSCALRRTAEAMATTRVMTIDCTTCARRFMAMPRRENSFREIGRDPVRSLRRHDDRLPALGELRMPEHELVRSDRDEKVRERRLADGRAVEENLRPWPRVHADADLRRVEANGGRLSRRHFDPLDFLKPDRPVREHD